MTISSTYSPVQYNGNGVTTVFAVPYEFYAASDLVVKSTVILTGVTTTLTITTDYTVSGGNGSTGNVTFVAAPASTVRITIERAIPYTQTQDYQENTAFPAATLETGLDKAVVMAQQAKAAADLALKFPSTDPSASRGEIPSSVSRANAILSFDANGVPSAVSLASLGNINISLTTPQTNDALVYNAGVWNNKSIGNITAAATTATPVTTDLIPFADVSDSNNTKKTTIQGILDLVSGVPIGTVLDYAGATAPTNYMFAYGQAISRTTYASLFSAIGIVYGSGDGSTTFNLPDFRGRIGAGRDDMGGSAANRITSGGSGIVGTTLGAAGGAETHTLTVAQLASHTHEQRGGTTGTGGMRYETTNASATLTNSGIQTVSSGSGQAHQNTQPSIIINKIIRVQ